MEFTPTRLQVAATAAVITVAARAVSVLVEPSGSEGSTRELLAAAAAHPWATRVSVWADMLAFAAAALATVTVTGLVGRGRGRRLTLAGGWLATTSYLALGFSPLGLISIGLAAQPDRPAMAKAYDAVSSDAGLVPILVLLTLGLVFPIVQAVGLGRAGVLGWWFTGVTVLQAVAFFALGNEHSRPLNLLGLVPFAVIFGAFAVLLRSRATRAGVDAPASAMAPAAA